MVQADSPEMYRNTLTELCMHHVVDEHEWAGGSCSFHDLRKCGCGSCAIGSAACPNALPYTSANTLSCPMHLMAYRIVMRDCAKRAEEVIHPVMGRGHSNTSESKFSVLPKYRAKNKALEKSSYEFYTTLGLIQGNMAWAYNDAAYGHNYHWIVDVLTRMNLPVHATLVDTVRARTARSQQAREKQKTEKYKQERISRKQARAVAAEGRSKWARDQKIKLSYGDCV